MCDKESSSENAGWYVHNSVRVKDIYPVWREPGGGVTSNSLLKNVDEAFEQSINYTKQNIAKAKKHLEKLIKARENNNLTN